MKRVDFNKKFTKRGGTAEVDAYCFRPQKGINLYGAK